MLYILLFTYRTAPTLVFLLMLACRLVVDWQMTGKEDEDDEEDLDASTTTTTTTSDLAAASKTTTTKGKTKNQLIKTKKDN